MASDESDVDDFVDLDVATFSKHPSDISPDTGNGQMDQKTHQLEGWFDDEDNHNLHHEVLSDDLMNDPFLDSGAFLTFDSNVQTYLIALESNKHAEQFNHYLNTSTIHFDSEEPSPSPSFVDPFSEGIFHSDESRNQFSSAVFDSDVIMDFQVASETAVRPTEYVYLNRQPGENLGMVLAIEGDQENRQTIDTVAVKSVTPGGAVSRSCQGNNRILVGDEISEIDGQRLNELTHDECIALFQEMPDNVVLTITRKEKVSEAKDDTFCLRSSSPRAEATRRDLPVPLPRKTSSRVDSCNTSSEHLPQNDILYNDHIMKIDSDHQRPARHNSSHDHRVPSGFCKLNLALLRDEDSLGLSIVPSYGATCDLYQIKRFLHSGTCAKSGLLEIGDRLLACNGQSLKGLTQAQCLHVLKASDRLVNLTVLRLIGDKEHAPLTDDTVGHLPPPLDFELEESYFHSSYVSNAESQRTDTEQRSRLSKAIQETLIDFNDNDDTESQEEVINNGEESENDYLVNFSAIPLVATGNNAVVTEEESYWQKIVNSDNKYGRSSFHISPPAQFSDADHRENIELADNEEDVPVRFTNIDDLLFGTVENTSTASCSNDVYVYERTNSNTNNEELLLISFDQKTGKNTSNITLNDTPTQFLDTAFAPQCIYKQSEESFDNIENNIDKTKTKARANYSAEYARATKGKPLLSTEYQEKFVPSSQSNSLVTIIPVLGTEEKVGSLSQSSNLVTIIPVSSVSSSEEYVSKITLSPVNHSEIPSFSETTVQPQATLNTHSFTRNISVNSQPPVCVSHIDVLSSKNIVQEDTLPPVKNITDASISVVFQTHGGSSASTLKSATIKVGELVQQEADMSDQLAYPAVHTTVGVVSTCQSGEEEELVQPMAVVKDSQGAPLCVPSLQPVTGHSNKLRILDGDAKRDIADVLSAITRISSPDTRPALVENRKEEEVSEQEIIPTILTNDQKDIVEGILNHWAAVESSNKTNVFHKAISDIIDSDRRSNKHFGPENVLVHATVSSDKEVDLIQPMIITKDHQQKQLNVPSSQSEQSILDVRMPDRHAKLDSADVMSSFNVPHSALSVSSWDAHQTGQHSEDAVMLINPSNDRKKIAPNVLYTPGNTDKPDETSIIQYAVTDINVSHDPNDIGIASSYNVESVNTEVINKTADNSNYKAKLNTVVEDIVQASSIATTGNSPYNIVDERHVSEQSADNLVHKPGTEQVILKYNIKPAAELNKYEQSESGADSDQKSGQVTMRNKSKHLTDFSFKSDHFQQPQVPDSSSISLTSRRPSSMIDASPVSASFPRGDVVRKSGISEGKPAPVFRPLSALRPLSASTANVHHLSSGAPVRPASGSFSSSTFASKVTKSDYPKTRQKDGSSFQVDVLKGIAGLGLKVRVTPEGHTQVTEIQPGGPIHKDGQIRVGDYLLFINSTDLSGQTDGRVQQILRLLPRGLTKLVVSSAILTSHSDFPQQLIDNSSYSSLSSYQPKLAEKHQPIMSVNSDSFLPTVRATDFSFSHNKDVHPSGLVGICTEEPNFSQNKDVHPSHLATPVVIDTAESALRVSNAHVSDKMEVPTTSQESPCHITGQEKQILTSKSEHDVLLPKAMPRHGLIHSANESYEASSEKTRAIESQNLTDLSVVDVDRAYTQTTPAGGKISFESKQFSPSESSRETFEQKAEVGQTTRAPLELDTHPQPSGEAITTSRKDQLVSTVSSSLSPTSEDLTKAVTTAQLLVKERSVSKENLEPVRSPGKVPPPVAPKPCLSSVALTRTEDNINVDRATKPQHRISDEYERLQTVSKVPPRPSSIVDRTGSFVTSTAKMFDNKAISIDTASEQALTIRRVSRGIVTHTDNSMTVNTSLLPAQERQKNSQVANPVSLSRPVTLSSSSLLNSRTVGNKEVISREVGSPDFSYRSDEDVDVKASTLLSPTRLNTALSPRRTSSIDSPTSPPNSLPIKHAPTVKVPTDKSPSKSHNEISQLIQKHGIYQSTPLTLITKKSPPQVSPSPSSHSGQSSHIVSSKHYRESFTSPDLSPPYSTKEEAFQDTLKQFDNLLIDTSYPCTETDPVDLLSLFPIKNDNTLPLQVSETSYSQTPDFRKPIAVPRKKPEPKESEKECHVKDQEEGDLIKVQGEQKSMEVEQSREESHVEVPTESLIEVISLVSPPAETSTLLDYRGGSKEFDVMVPSHIPQWETKSQRISAENLPNEMNTLDTSGKVEKDSRHLDEPFELSNKLLEDSKWLSDTSSNQLETVVQNDSRMEHVNIFEQKQFHQGSSDVVNHQTDESFDSKAIYESFWNSSFTNSRETEINNTAIQEESKSNETHLENLEAQASQIVAAILDRILKNPDMFHHDESEINNEATSQGSLEDEPPALPGTPPPLPGVPPPSNILTETSLLFNAQDVVYQNWSEHIAEHPESSIDYRNSSLLEESSSPSSVQLAVNTFLKSAIVNQLDVSVEDLTSKADSVEPLNSTTDSFLYDDGLGVSSQDPADLLSEDSGIPIDEDQEVATDDAISPPSEFMQIVSEKVQFSSDTAINLLPSAVAQENENLAEDNTKSSAAKVPLLSDAKFDETSKGASDNNTFEDNLPPSLPPTSTCPSVTLMQNTTNYTEDFLSQTSLSKLQGLMSSPPLEINLFDDISTGENKELVQEEFTHYGAAIQSYGFEAAEKSVPDQSIHIASVHAASDLVTTATEKALFPAADIPLVTVISKRSWCLRSNKSKLPILSGDSQVSVHIDYTKKSVISSLIPEDLKSLLDRANAVLDAVSAADNMVITVVQFYQDKDSTHVCFDLAHEGGIWYKVTGVTKISSLWEEVGVESGVWLVSVNDLWCDQLSLMDFQSRLAKLKQDLLLVFVREEKPGDIAETKSAKPVPSPRSRSAHTQEKDEQILNSGKDMDIVKITADVKVPIMGLINNRPVANERQHKQEKELQQYISERGTPELCKVSELSIPLPDQTQPPLPDTVTPLPTSLLLDEVSQQGKQQLQEEKMQPSLKEVLQPARDGLSTPAKPDPISNRDFRETEVEHKINGAPLPSSSVPVKSLPTNIGPEKDHLAVANSQSSKDSPGELGPGIHKVVMIKGATGIGFCLEGGMYSPKGNMPVIIKKIFKGGPAEKCGKLKVRDEILEVNGVKFDSMRHTEAWNHLKFLDDGELHITLRRP